jgi:hypothetical protein
LIRNALAPKERPTPESEYRELLDRYKTDVAFAELVERVADGLGLDVHAPSPLGLLVSGRIESPFAITLDNSGLPVRSPTDQRLQDRRCFGLVLLAIVAYAYPNGEALIDPTSLPIRPPEIERFLEQRISRLTDLDVESDYPEGQLSAAAATWKDLPAMLVTDKKRVARDSHRWYVNKTLEFLVEQNRARREPTLDTETGEAYILNDRFRIGLTDVSESLIHEMSAAGADEPGAS